MSKGLGAPVGSLLAGPADLIRQARVERKRLGGAMRQVGILAAAGLVALDRVDRLADDHARARVLAQAAADRWPGSVDVALVETNIVRIAVPDPAAVIAHLGAAGVLALSGSATTVRLVTHADVDDDDVGPRGRGPAGGAVIESSTPARALAVYAHPDDPEVGCGGTLARWVTRGAEVHLVIANRGDKGSSDATTDPDALAAHRADEVEQAAAVLGLAGVEHLGLPGR